MSVYIKGMKMPKSCEYCRFSGFGGLKNERIVCMFTGTNAYINTMQYLNDCPLVSIPAHGKLIDADEFLRRAIGTKCFDEDYARMLQELVGESITIIPADDSKEE